MANKTVEDFKPFIHPDVPGVDKYILDRYIRFTIEDFCEKTWILQKGITLTIDSEDIESDMFDSIVFSLKSYFPYHRPFAIKTFKIKGTDWNLKNESIVNDTSYLDNIRTDSFDDYKVFEIFSLYNVRLAPFTTADDGSEIYIKAVFKPIPDFTQVSDIIYNDWMECIAAGTKARLLDIPGKPWTNHPASNRWERVYRSRMSDAKRQINKQFQGRPNTVNPREFGF